MAGSVLVDSSVWIDVLRDPRSGLAAGFDELVRGPVRAVTTGVIAQEVLQGLRRPRDIARVTGLLRALPRLAVTLDTHQRAAALFRGLRAAGVAAHTVDVLIAQVAIERGTRLWSLDEHFGHIASASRLRLFRM